MPETDFAQQLARLAPEVDEAAAKDVFERHRQPSGTPRWLLPAAVVVLIVVGVTGLVLMRGDDATAPVSPVDDALRPHEGETLIADEAYFDVATVAETTVGFGNAALVGSTDELESLWVDWNPGVAQPDVAFAEVVALVMTRPDDACADVVTRFEVTDRNGTSTWTPVFEERADACVLPLLSWLYVVAIDRAALGDRADIVVPAAELYDVPEQTIEYTAPQEAPDGTAETATVTVTPTDVVVPLPPEGEPELHNTAAGMFYVVNHGDGDVSIVPAVRDRPVDDDLGVTMLQSFVVPSESGGSFFSDGDVWDAWGRAATLGRTDDLTGYAARVDGDEVTVLYSDQTRVEGDPDVPDSEEYPLPPRPPFEGITPEQFVTLSSSGPIWRLFDAELVVENGVGRICDVDMSLPVDQLQGCDESGIVIDTNVTSSDPDIATWFEAPVLAFQDPIRGFTNVIPLAGASSRNDVLVELADDSVVTSVEIVCAGPDGQPVARVNLDLPPGESRTLTIVDGDQEYGQGVASGSGQTSIGFGLTASPPDTAELVVSVGGKEDARLPIPSGHPTCTQDGASVESVPTMLLFGDSVMLGAANGLVDRGYTVDTKPFRQLTDAGPELTAIIDDGLIDDVPTVLHLGTNGPFDGNDLDELLDLFGEERAVYLLTVSADRSWTEPNNELIAAAGDRPNVTVIDWATIADGCPLDCFMADGVHLSEFGREYYADLIADTTGR